jgi:ribosomal protein S18 acetylase RimI-like enzyme
MPVRPATQDDFNELLNLMIDFERQTQTKLPPDQAAFRAYVDTTAALSALALEYISPAFYTFVNADHGKLVGYISGEIKEKPNRRFHKEGYVKDWYVHSEHRGQSQGKPLFDALTKVFKDAGCTHISLSTHVSNKAAIKIYEHMGLKQRTIEFFKPL